MFEWMSANGLGAKRMVETTGAYDGGAVGVCSGLVAGTRVATAMGWRPIEAIAEGDLVLTFDSGLQPVSKVERRPVWNGEAGCPRRFWPMNVPAGALGNQGALTLLPGQYVMIESDAGEELFGDPFSLIHAAALEGLNGIKACPPQRDTQAVVLHFDCDQVVFAETGVLFYCPSSRSLLDRVAGACGPEEYRALSEDDTEALLMCIECDAAADSMCVPVSGSGLAA